MQINRVIHGSTAKNASMSQSKKMLELKAMRNEKLDNHEKEGKGEWKSQDDDDDAGDRKPKRKAVQLQENLVEVTINNTPVQILCPPKRVQAAGSHFMSCHVSLFSFVHPFFPSFIPSFIHSFAHSLIIHRQTKRHYKMPAILRHTGSCKKEVCTLPGP